MPQQWTPQQRTLQQRTPQHCSSSSMINDQNKGADKKNPRGTFTDRRRVRLVRILALLHLLYHANRNTLFKHNIYFFAMKWHLGGTKHNSNGLLYHRDYPTLNKLFNLLLVFPH